MFIVDNFKIILLVGLICTGGFPSAYAIDCEVGGFNHKPCVTPFGESTGADTCGITYDAFFKNVKHECLKVADCPVDGGFTCKDGKCCCQTDKCNVVTDENREMVCAQIPQHDACKFSCLKSPKQDKVDEAAGGIAGAVISAGSGGIIDAGDIGKKPENVNCNWITETCKIEAKKGPYGGCVPKDQCVVEGKAKITCKPGTGTCCCKGGECNKIDGTHKADICAADKFKGIAKDCGGSGFPDASKKGNAATGLFENYHGGFPLLALVSCFMPLKAFS